MSQGFYVVWNPQHGSPKYRHTTAGQAVLEAERLASVNPGSEFFVLKAVARSISRTVNTERLDTSDDDMHTIPF